MKATYIGKVEGLDLPKGTFANLYRVEGGYIIRTIKEYASNVGPALFNGRVFNGSDFVKVRVTDLGYGIDRAYALKAE
jgi:hypothetical protein